MAVLRRRTSKILGFVIIAATLAFGTLAILALVWRPETRVPALGAWVVLAAGFHVLAGERLSLASCALAAGFTLPLVFSGVAAFEMRQRWELPMNVCISAPVGLFILTGVFFVRAMVASGSADYPYDD